MVNTIGIIGQLGSGKDTVGKYLKEKIGWDIYELSSILKKEAIESKLEQTRENLIDILRIKHSQFGEGYLIEEILKGVKNNGIITGIRMIKQIEVLRSKSNSYLIYVTCDKEIRFQRQLKRMKTGDLLSIEDFNLIEEKEENDINKIIYQDIIKNSADLIISNNGTEEELKEKINLIFKNNLFYNL